MSQDRSDAIGLTWHFKQCLEKSQECFGKLQDSHSVTVLDFKLNLDVIEREDTFQKNTSLLHSKRAMTLLPVTVSSKSDHTPII